VAIDDLNSYDSAGSGHPRTTLNVTQSLEMHCWEAGLLQVREVREMSINNEKESLFQYQVLRVILLCSKLEC